MSEYACDGSSDGCKRMADKIAALASENAKLREELEIHKSALLAAAISANRLCKDDCCMNKPHWKSHWEKINKEQIDTWLNEARKQKGLPK